MPKYFQLLEVIIVNVFLHKTKLFGVASLLSTWYHTLSKRSTTLACRWLDANI